MSSTSEQHSQNVVSAGETLHAELQAAAQAEGSTDAKSQIVTQSDVVGPWRTGPLYA